MSGPPGWLERPRTITRLVYALYGACALLLAADLVMHKHAHFAFEHWFGFYGLFGFAACCGMVLLARLLRPLLRRDEDYYGEGRGDGDD
jgi:hypothetical protein